MTFGFVLQCWHGEFLSSKAKAQAVKAVPELGRLLERVTWGLDMLKAGLLQACNSLLDELKQQPLLLMQSAEIDAMLVEAVLKEDDVQLRVLGDDNFLGEPLSKLAETQRACLTRAKDLLEQLHADTVKMSV